MLTRIRTSALEFAIRAFTRTQNRGRVKEYNISNAIALIDAKIANPNAVLKLSPRARSVITNLVAGILNTTPLYNNLTSFQAARAQLAAFSSASHNAVSVVAAYTPTSTVAPGGGALSNTRSSTQSTTFTYQWGRVSGPGTASITAPTSASTSVSGLAAGTHVFRVTVTDSKGNVGVGDVSVVVTA